MASALITPKEIPLLFTPDNRAAVRTGIKTETRRTDPNLDNITAEVPGSSDGPFGVYYPVLTPDNDWVFWSPGPVTEEATARAYPKGSNAGIKPRYGCPQVEPVRYWKVEPVRYWMREPVRLLYLSERYNFAVVKYCDDSDVESSAVALNSLDVSRLLARKDWTRPTADRFMLKSFTRTWLTGWRVWPERLGDITPEGAIAEGIELCPTVCGGTTSQINRQSFKSRPAWRDYLNGGYDLTPVQSYVSLWESIRGAGSWDPQRWVWVVQWESKETTR